MRRATNTFSLLVAALTLCQAGCGTKTTVVSLSLASLQGGQASAPTAEGFSFPADEGGKLLAELLTPDTRQVSPREVRREPLTLPAPAALEQPDLKSPLPPVETALPQATLAAAGRPFQPRLLKEDAPFARESFEPEPPERRSLPAGALARQPSPSVDEPVPLPILATPAADRASLDDPTMDQSVAAALQTVVPERTAPAPVVFVNLPDPFEHTQPIRLKALPPEEVAPASPGPEVVKR